MNKAALLSSLLKGEDLCRACAEQGPSCCRSLPGQRAESFPLSTAEWERLCRYIHLADACPELPGELEGPRDSGNPVAGHDLMPGDAIRTAEPNSPEFLISMRAIFPLEKPRVNALFPAGGAHWRLRTTPGGACIFLGYEGCRIPRPARPWYCRIYPAWISGGHLTLFMSETCLIARHVSAPKDGLALLGISLEDVRQLYAGLRRDWGFPPDPREGLKTSV